MSEDQELNTKIVHQVEYYFGDVNLLRDKFLQFEIKEHGGWVPIDSLMRCNRLKQICGDGTVVLNALESGSELMDVDIEQRQVRRDTEKFPLPANAEDLFRELNVRTLYVKGFDADSRLDSIYEYIGPAYRAQVVQVTLRKNPKNRTIFKGSVFIAFKNKEDAEKFLNDPEKAKFRDKDVIRKFKNDYFDEKKKVRETRKAEAKASTMYGYS